MGPDEVGSHPDSRSPFGLDDMSGNAFEWTTSTVNLGSYVGRGGSYYHDRKTIQVVNRAVSSPAIRDATLGVRMCAAFPR
jgi:formylglycine-generating enzyme required for sulfatase activity